MDPQDNTPVETPDEENPTVEADEQETEETTAEEVPAEVLRANLTKANQEAARYRLKVREVEAELAKRKTPEEVEELRLSLQTERETAERSLLIENVALKFNLPEELASVLQGSTREDLEKHAATLAKFAPQSEQVPPGDLNGGLNPGNDSTNDGLDPLERVRKIKGYR